MLWIESYWTLGCQLESDLDVFLTIFVKNVDITSQIKQLTPQKSQNPLLTLTLCAVVFPPKIMSLPGGWCHWGSGLDVLLKGYKHQNEKDTRENM